MCVVVVVVSSAEVSRRRCFSEKLIIMPLRSSHVFASHKGGAGKTMLAFQAACQYAYRNPEERVLVYDMTELGDVSMRLLGGVQRADSAGAEVFGKIYEVLEDAEKSQKSQKEASSLMGWIRNWRGGASQTPAFDVTAHAVHASDYNDHIPENIWLISSGAQTCDDQERPAEERKRIASAMRKALEDSKDTWKVFLDTDGDRRPSPNTQIAYDFADYCVIPLEPDECDFGRLEPMIEFMAEAHANGDMACRVQLMCWNRLQVTNGNKPSGIGYFTAPKVCQDMVRHLNKRMFEIAKKSEGLFVHDSDLTNFTTHGTLLVREFPDCTSRPANASGLPFCMMAPGSVTTLSGLEFKISKEQIDNCKQNIDQLLQALGNTDEMDVEA